MNTITVKTIESTDIMVNHVPRSWDNKENTYTAYGLAVVDEKIQTVAVARWYMGRSSNASTVHCAVTISTDAIHTHGHGSAGGYGYDKNSAALGEALRDANVELSDHIDGTGRSREAFDAIVRHLCPNATHVGTFGAPS